MNCKYCNKEINNKGGLVKHERGCKFNPEKVEYKSNFVEYNEKVKTGLLKKNKNQFQLAKEKEEVYRVSKEVREKISKKKKGVPCHTKESREKISLARSKTIEELGKGGFKHIKWYVIRNINNEEFIVRGRWELLVANKLNEAKIEWKRKVYLKYNDENGIKRTYTPDFYLPSLNKYIEVKGYFSEKDKEKLKRVLKENNINLLLIREADIKNENELIEKIQGSISSLL